MNEVGKSATRIDALAKVTVKPNILATSPLPINYL
jgi:hypothetical protein